MKIGLKWIGVVVFVFAIGSVYLSYWINEQRFRRAFYRKDLVNQLQLGIDNYVKDYGEIPKYGNVESITCHLEERGMAQDTAKKITKGLTNIRKSEFLFFWLFDEVNRIRGQDSDKYYGFPGGVWDDKDANGFLEIYDEELISELRY